MNQEERYIKKRLWKARVQSLAFYVCRVFPVKRKKAVFCCIEGTTGYTCNPKYIAEELHRRGGYELIWLVNDRSKSFPSYIRPVHNSLWRRAYHLTTAGFWIDNSRKQLEARKRRGQVYIQTWHAKLGFKPTCLDRGASFSKIAYLVSRHDSEMIDYVLSNSDWYDATLPRGMIYEGPVLRTGSPRCDILVNGRRKAAKAVRKKFHLPQEERVILYAPTFRGGSQGTERKVAAGQRFPDYGRLRAVLAERFGGSWTVFVRLHPQLVARNLDGGAVGEGAVDVSRVDDLYEVLAGCDAFLTDYSSAAFDAAVMRIPVFLYADDYQEYTGERGKLLWDLRKLPFPFAEDEAGLWEKITSFEDEDYQQGLERLFEETGMQEDGKAAARVCDLIARMKG